MAAVLARYFNPRTLQESATYEQQARSRLGRYFNPRTLQESATMLDWLIQPATVNFNPRTLQESATKDIHGDNASKVISIHAPYKRVRPKAELVQTYILLFQSTHPTRECDPTIA